MVIQVAYTQTPSSNRSRRNQRVLGTGTASSGESSQAFRTVPKQSGIPGALDSPDSQMANPRPQGKSEEEQCCVQNPNSAHRKIAR
jgi:hypothetical protein